MALAPGDRLGSYTIVRLLGAGGMGEVYRARDTRLGREVALKILPAGVAADPDRLERFEREARTVASLNHPGIVTLHSVEEAEGVRFLTMELVEGRSLDQLLEPAGLPVARTLEIAIAVAQALAAAHEKGVVHRDLKPANLMETADGRVKVLDFGLAKMAAPGTGSATSETLAATRADTVATPLTSTGLIFGTAPYMAPEQIRGEPVDARTDLFSLGVVLYELLSGRRPFQGRTFADVSSSILRDTPEALTRARPEVPARLDALVLRCLAKDPRERCQSALEVLRELRAVQGALDRGLADTVAATAGAPATPEATPGAATVPPRSARTAPRMHARRLWIGAFAALVLAALAGAYLWQRGRANHPAAGRRCVAVLEFENDTGDPSLDWMKRGVAELLSSALVQSPELDVFDAQRMGDLAGADHVTWPPPTAKYEFLARHHIPRAIIGNILRSGNELRIEGRLVDTDGGRPVHSYAVEGPADSGLFNVTGRLVANLQAALEVNLTGDREAEGWLREITTTSVDAYRLYLRGHEALLANHMREAATAYEQALSIDSTFIAARSELAGAYWNLGDEPKLELTRAAMRRLRSRADHRGQLRIDLLESVVTNDPPGIIRAASELSQLYPENRFYTYLLGRGYYTSKQYQRCIDTLRPLVEQRYEWGWTYVLTAQSYVHLGDRAAARRNFELGLEITKGDPEVSYAYVRFLESIRDYQPIRGVVDQGLLAPALAETPVGEGELRMELAKDLLRRGDEARARQEMARASKLIPNDDEARAEADSMMRVLGGN